MILEESGYTEMWQADRSAEAPGRLENLKELIRSMEEFESLDRLPRARLAGHGRRAEGEQRRASHHDAALGQGAGVRHRVPARLGGRPVPLQRTLDESGRAGLEEERRLAYVGLTRARKRAYIWFASNRRMHGLWQIDHALALPRRTAGGPCRGRRGTSSYGGYGAASAATAAAASTRRDPFDEHLLHARLAARPEEPRPGRRDRRLRQLRRPERRSRG